MLLLCMRPYLRRSLARPSAAAPCRRLTHPFEDALEGFEKRVGKLFGRLSPSRFRLRFVKPVIARPSTVYYRREGRTGSVAELLAMEGTAISDKSDGSTSRAPLDRTLDRTRK